MSPEDYQRLYYNVSDYNEARRTCRSEQMDRGEYPSKSEQSRWTSREGGWLELPVGELPQVTAEYTTDEMTVTPDHGEGVLRLQVTFTPSQLVIYIPEGCSLVGKERWGKGEMRGYRGPLRVTFRLPPNHWAGWHYARKRSHPWFIVTPDGDAAALPIEIRSRLKASRNLAARLQELNTAHQHSLERHAVNVAIGDTKKQQRTVMADCTARLQTAALAGDNEQLKQAAGCYRVGSKQTWYTRLRWKYDGGIPALIRKLRKDEGLNLPGAHTRMLAHLDAVRISAQLTKKGRPAPEETTECSE
jgi:hypothetical protein